MKKSLYAMVLLAGVLTLSACSSKEAIGEDKAMQIALDDAGVKQQDALFTEQSFDKEDFEYSFTFKTSDTEYEYDIDGNGDIIQHEKKALKVNNVANNNTTKNSASLTDEQKEYLNIALTHFQLQENEVSGILVEKDYADGIEVFEVEFHNGTNEYTCDVRVDNKEVINSDMDSE